MITNLLETLILSLVQGISEFIPVSSSAHLFLISNIYEFKNSSLQIDVSLHLGSLLAIIVYFRNDLINFFKEKNLAKLIIIGSLPLIFFGYFLLKSGYIENLRNLKIISWTTLTFAILLYFADRIKIDKSLKNDLSLKNIFIIGIFQVLALVPGVSRSGIVMTVGRFLSFNRVDASKISFLLSIPALAGASVLSLKDVFEKPIELNYLIVLAIISSFIFSFLTVKFFLIYINKFSMNAFVIYRIVIALILFNLIY